ncbi:hypothetical protein ACRN93_07785 [Shewanella baltica]|uniref:hypothetical protein n=1 Tax=Shewanella baltica TaxID=62322 RepID=UPI00217DADCF|nr:hypothetical protein [Shewanella baltica]MCS6204715.1 hypothetical protein [Shewanella baltica]
MTFDDMDVIVEPPWMASRRVTEATALDLQLTTIQIHETTQRSLNPQSLAALN